MTLFEQHPYSYEAAARDGYLRAIGVRALDGDTIEALVDLGFWTYSSQQLRLAGINTPELVGTTGVVLQRALDAKAFTAAHTVDKPLLLLTHRTRAGDPVRSFTRIVAEVWSIVEPGGIPESLGAALIAAGLADPVP